MGLRNWVSAVVGSKDAEEAVQAGTAPPRAPAHSPLSDLVQVATQSTLLSLNATIEGSGWTIRLDARQSGGRWAYGSAAEFSSNGQRRHLGWHQAQTIAQCLTRLATDLKARGQLDVDSVRCRSEKSPVTGVALQDLCTAALCEAFGEAIPTPEALAARRETAKKQSREKGAKTRGLRKELLGHLEKGAEGVAEWNRRRKEARSIAPLKKVDLSGRDLSQAELVDMPESSFEKAILTGASLKGCDLRRSRFTDADLQGADLSGARLEGADLSGARLDNARWKGTHFDESTKWPKGFALPESLHWVGPGPSPAAIAAITARKKHEGPVDLAVFMKRVEKTIEKARLTKALSMLKKDRFQLFVEVTDEQLAGVVKSQTDPDLVYSCILGHDGRFSCCTQNLNVCGGLRGALCKHLLVLIVGVAQAGEASPDTLDDWVQRSTLHQPALQKDAQSAILLRYKGAEAGEIDWRPTETVPEDFYAY